MAALAKYIIRGPSFSFFGDLLLRGISAPYGEQFYLKSGALTIAFGGY